MGEKRFHKTGEPITDLLQHIDVTLFYFINQNLANPVFDKFFVFITDVKHWLLLYIFLWLMLLTKGNKTDKINAIVLVLLLIVSDQVSSHLLKNFFGRLRPCNALENVRLLVSCSHSFSMPSSHAFNNFAVATYLSVFYRKYAKIFFTIAVLIAFSRPYVGVHYPSDILVGAVLGFLLGYLFTYFVKLRFGKEENYE